MILPQGFRLDRYEVLSLLGKGGMGEVYLAFDHILRRKVALKLLPPHFSQNPDLFRRFAREAQAISRLNHPNIITIYDVKEVDSQHLIATEFIEGQTLSQMMSHSRLKPSTSIDLAVQIATGLAAAHAAGVVHRDVKPKNIMVRPDGFVKVLDFGLSKMMASPTVIGNDGSTLESTITEAGAVVGTLAYMSPEQLQGQEVDARSDIFSLGVVLYELVSGRAPFQAPTAGGLIAAILTADPPSLEPYTSEVLPDLSRIIYKSLRKEPDERYQTMGDLLVDLKSLKRELEMKPENLRVGSRIGNKAGSRSTMIRAAHNSRRLGTLLAWSILAIVLAGAGIRLFQLFGPENFVSTFHDIKLTKVTSSGKADQQEAAISPDGRYIAYVVAEAGRQSMRLRHIASGSDVQLIPPADMTFLGVTFTPDGNFIWYTAWDAATRSTLYQMPVLGGRSTKVLTQIDSPITFSPDGKQFAFVRGDKSLMIAQSDGSAQHELASCDKDEFWRYPAWSPDGSIIACSIGSSRGADDHVVAVGTRNGRKQTIPSQEWSSIFWMAWLADGSGLVLTALDQVSQLPQLWILSYPKGHSRRITNDLNSYYGVSLTGDSSSLVCVQGQRLSNIWVVPYGDSAHGIRVTSGTARDLGVAGITWTPDGQIVFTSKLAGHFNIWIMSKDGSDQRQLTANARDNYYPSVSPDGKSVAFISDRSGKNDLWKMDIDGSSPLQLTKSGGSGYPQWSMDGQWIVYEALEGSAATLRKISKDGGSSVLVIEMNARMPAISPDGKLVAFYQDLFGPTPARIATVPLAGGPSAVLLKGLPFAKLLQFHWSPDGRFLAFVDDKGGFSDIWIVPITGGSARKMTDFRTALIFTFDWSRDGKRLACACGSETSDVILISSLK